MKTNLVFVLIVLSAMGPASFGASSCFEIYRSEVGPERGPKNGTLDDLARLKMHVDEVRAHSANKLRVRSLELTYEQKFEAVLAEAGPLLTARDLSDRVDKAERKIRFGDPLAAERIARDRVIDGHQIIFNEVTPGSFRMGESGEQFEARIDEPFRMAVTQTTQFVWQAIVDSAQSRFPGEYNSLKPRPSRFDGDLNPVEHVSYLDIQLWLKAANALLKGGDFTAHNVIRGYRPGDVLRLPTEREWEYVARFLGSSDGDFHFGNDESSLNKHVWFYRNSNHSHHPIATKAPLIAGQAAYNDLHGNVWEIVDTYFTSMAGYKLSEQPTLKDLPIVIKGGAYDELPWNFTAGIRRKSVMDARNGAVGFRLAFSTPKPAGLVKPRRRGSIL